jgi:hypothetical protein
MKITGYGSINASTIKKRGDVAQTGSFADLLAASETEESSGVPASGEVAAAGLTNLLALQEISEEDIQRRKLVQQGKSMIDTLERLRQQLLIGTLPPHLLRDLHRQLSLHRQTTADPELNALIDDIELRAAVELAKLEMAFKAEEPDGL